MNPDICINWFIHSFLIEGIDLKDLKKSLSEIGLKEHKEKKIFSPYVAIFDDEMVCVPREQTSNGFMCELKIKNIEKRIPCVLKTYFYFESSGQCAYFIEIEYKGKSHLTVANIIKHSNLFEESDNWLYLDRNDDGILINKYANKNIITLKKKLGKIRNDVCYRNIYDSSQIKQLPYVATILGFYNSEEYREKIIKPLENQKSNFDDNSKALAAILYRFKTPDAWKEVDTSYMQAFTSRRGAGIENYHPHKGIFITLHLRSLLVVADVADEKGNTEKLIENYFPALRGTLADSRSKWFSLMVVNYQLDIFIRDIKKEIEPLYLVEKLIAFRKILISFLDSSVRNKHASGSLSEIQKEYSQIFGIDSLVSDILEKINQVEKIYNNIQHYRMLSFDDYEK